MGVQRKSSKRKQYTPEFKREAVRLVTEGGLSMARVAQDLGLDDNLVSRWKKGAQQNGHRALSGQGHPQDEELARLRRENDVLSRERDILKEPSASSRPRATPQLGDEQDALSLHPKTSEPVAKECDVPGAGSLIQRLSWVEKAAYKRAPAAKAAVSRSHLRTL